MKKCPQFNSCNATFCPLDYYQKERVIEKDDTKCPQKKFIRYNIGKDTELPLKGLTKREWIGKKLSESLR